MTNPRTWLGLVVALLVAGVLWWQQGDAGTTAEDPRTGPTTSQSPTSEPPGLPSPSDTGPASGVPVVSVDDLPPETLDTLALIAAGGPYLHDQDDETFQNREGILPDEPDGYYREYTVETPGSDDRGARRIVTGSNGELYWTDDHYSSFSRIAR